MAIQHERGAVCYECEVFLSPAPDPHQHDKPLHPPMRRQSKDLTQGMKHSLETAVLVSTALEPQEGPLPIFERFSALYTQCR